MAFFDEKLSMLELSDGREWLVLFSTRIGDDEYAVLSPRDGGEEFMYVKGVEVKGKRSVEVVKDERLIAQIQAAFLLQQNGGSRLKAIGQVFRNRFRRS